MRRAAIASGAAAAVLAFVVFQGCSLLAPSDDEAMRGTTNGIDPSGTGNGSSGGSVDGATTIDGANSADGSSGSSGSSNGGPDGSGLADTGGPDVITTDQCKSCVAACNNNTCASCLHNGGKCSSSDQCCTNNCNLSTLTCVPGAIVICTPAATHCNGQTCCAGLTCSAALAGNCAACALISESCDQNLDCCSTNCVTGKCAACVPAGIPVGDGADSFRRCCSGKVVDNKCK